MDSNVEAGQEWRSKRNGRVVKVTQLHFDDHEPNQVISVTIRDGNRRRPITATNTTIPGYERVVSDFVDFGEVARGRLSMQSQYASHYVCGTHDSPNLGEGLRFQKTGGDEVDPADYHFIEIHKDDVETFVQRVLDYRRARGVIP